MKIIINGFRYDTNKAERLGRIPCPNEADRDDTWHETFLYRTPRGAGISWPAAAVRSACGADGAATAWSGGDTASCR